MGKMKFFYTEYHYYMQLSFFCCGIISILSILLIELHTIYDYYKQKRTIIIEQNVKPGLGLEPPQINSNNTSSTPPTINKNIPIKRSFPNPIRRKLRSKRFVSYLLPILSYFFYLLMNIFSLLTKLDVQICAVAASPSTICYFLAKMWMYFVFMYKSHIVYSKSLFQYNKKLLYSFVAGVVLYSLIIIIFSITTVELNVIHFGDIKVCEARIMFGVLESTVLFDLVIQIGCCYLFVRPLLILSKMNERLDQSEHEKLFNVILKYVICTFVAVSSTFILLITMAISKLVSLVAFDVIINCICIMLLNRKYDLCFKIACCGCKKICSVIFGAKYAKKAAATEMIDV
eukprot:193762_1